MAKRPKEDGSDLISIASKLIFNTFMASLATNWKNGYPFVSWISFAADGNRQPVLLMSDLAIHTQNIKRDDRVSILLTSVDGHGLADQDDQLAQARLTLVGHLRTADNQNSARDAFLSVHPEARAYAGFADFRFYLLAIEEAHLVAGFGRVVTMTKEQVQHALDRGAMTS